MDVDCTKTLTSLPQPCYQYGHPGHISRDCPNQYNIHLVTTGEQDKFVEQLIADCDRSMTAAREVSQVSEGSFLE
jgi:hypothetical protein